MRDDIIYRPPAKNNHTCFPYIRGVNDDGDIKWTTDLYPHGTVTRCPECKTLWVSSSWCTQNDTWHKLRKLRWYHLSRWRLSND